MTAHATNAGEGCTFTPLRLQPRPTSSSYDLVAGDIDALAAFLHTAGYKSQPPSSEIEAHRLRHPDSRGLAVIYHSGCLLCQGQAAAVHAAVAHLIDRK